MTKLQLSLGAGVVAAFVVFWGIQHQSQARLNQENASLRQQLEQLAQLQADNERLSNLVAHADSAPSREQFAELLRLRGEVNSLRRQTNEVRMLQQQNQQFRERLAASQTAVPNVKTPPEVPLADIHPKETWAYVGYTTPDNTIQSMLWGMMQTNKEAFLGGFSPEMSPAMENDLTNFPDGLTKDLDGMTGFRIVNREQISADEMDLTIYIDGQDHQDKTHFHRINGEWKVTGPTPASQPQQ